MKELNEEDLDTAITLGDAVCNELGICCEKRGRVIFQIYKKLEDLKPQRGTAVSSAPSEAHADKEHSSQQEHTETLQNADNLATN